MLNKKFYEIKEMEEFFNKEENSYIFKGEGRIEFTFDLKTKANITAKECNIIARHLECNNIDANFISAYNIKCKNINCNNNIKAIDIFAEDINCACTINASAICCRNLKCEADINCHYISAKGNIFCERDIISSTVEAQKIKSVNLTARGVIDADEIKTTLKIEGGFIDAKKIFSNEIIANETIKAQEIQFLYFCIAKDDIFCNKFLPMGKKTLKKAIRGKIRKLKNK